MKSKHASSLGRGGAKIRKDNDGCRLLNRNLARLVLRGGDRSLRVRLLFQAVGMRNTLWIGSAKRGLVQNRDEGEDHQETRVSVPLRGACAGQQEHP